MPGPGRSRLQESSLIVEAGLRIVIDVTRDFERQSRALEHLDGALITRAHADACGGIAQLQRWLRARAVERLPLYASTARRSPPSRSASAAWTTATSSLSGPASGGRL